MALIGRLKYDDPPPLAMGKPHSGRSTRFPLKTLFLAPGRSSHKAGMPFYLREGAPRWICFVRDRFSVDGLQKLINLPIRGRPRLAEVFLVSEAEDSRSHGRRHYRCTNDLQLMCRDNISPQSDRFEF